MTTESQPVPAQRGRMLVPLLGSAALILCISMGTRQTFGLYLTPLTTSLGWGRTEFAFAIAVQNLVSGLAQPFAGMLADRIGAFRVIVVGALVYALGVLGMSLSTVPLVFNLFAGLLVGVGLSATSIAIVVGAVGRMVTDQQRSRALGITIAGFSLGQLIMLPFGQALISAYGWQNSLAIMSALTLLMVPLAVVFARRSQHHTAGATRQRLGDALSEASRHRGYLLLTAGFFVCGFHVAFISTHLPSYLADNKFPPATGAVALMLIGLFNIIGTYTWGHLGDSYPKKRLLSAIYLSRAVVIAVLLLAPKSVWTIYICSSALGFIWLGTVALTSGLVGQIFGLQYLSTLFGFTFLSHQVGSFLGAWLGGVVFDAVGSYEPMWIATIVMALIATGINWPIDDRTVVRPVEAPAPATPKSASQPGY